MPKVKRRANVTERAEIKILKTDDMLHAALFTKQITYTNRLLALLHKIILPDQIDLPSAASFKALVEVYSLQPMGSDLAECIQLDYQTIKNLRPREYFKSRNDKIYQLKSTF